MNTIINKNTKSFKEFEKNIFDIICLIGESLTSYILEKWDDEINENRDKKNTGIRDWGKQDREKLPNPKRNAWFGNYSAWQETLFIILYL